MPFGIWKELQIILLPIMGKWAEDIETVVVDPTGMTTS
jgi:hypothetical protein